MKRRLVKLVVFLLLGAIINVAVAWGFALLSEHPMDRPQAHSHDGRLTWIVETGQAFGITAVSAVPDNDIWALADTGHVEVPPWSLAIAPPTESRFNDPTGPWTMEFGYGWPLRSAYALTQARIRDAAGAHVQYRFNVVSGMAALDDGSATPMPYHVLPVRPIWPGFAINTLFYAFILWLLFAAPFALRRRWRIKRRLCAKCAYPVGDSPVCTECGAKLPSPSR